MLARLILLPLLTISLLSAAQTSNWNGREAAVVLTYDDALDVHLDNVMPALDSTGLKATFYLTVFSPAFTKRINEWKAVAAKGHELGNHTLFHPCLGNLPGRSFVQPDYDLARYTIKRIQDEIRMTNTTLEALDGQKQRSFAYPCGDVRIGDTAYLDGLHADVASARGVHPQQIPKDATDLYMLGAYSADGRTGEQLISIVKEAVKNKSLVVFLFHGVGGGHGLNTTIPAHSQLLRYLSEHSKEIWNPTFVEASLYLRKANRK